MKTVFFILITLGFLVLLYLGYLGHTSRKGSAPGLVDQQLSPCVNQDNCVCSEGGSGSESYISPADLPAGLNLEALVEKLKQILVEMGAVVEVEQGPYMAATFQSSVFGFVDDFELRIDSQSNRLHLRSASRVGTSDLGANRKRVHEFIDRVAKL